MKDKAFERAMSQIANEAEAEQKRELQVAERRKFWGKVRKACTFLFGAAVIAGGFYFREDLGQCASKVKETIGIGGDAKVKGETTAALNDIREGAAKRDKVLDEISQTGK